MAIFRDIEYLRKKYSDIYQFIRDICLFISRDMDHLVSPYTRLTTTSETSSNIDGWDAVFRVYMHHNVMFI